MNKILEFRLKRKLLVNLEPFDDYMVRDYITRYSWIKPTQTNYNIIKSALEEHNANKILDIGCGSGYWTYQLNEMGFDTEGIKIEMYVGRNTDGVDTISLCEKCKFKNFYDMNDEELNKYDTFYISWPPYNQPLATDVLKKFLKLSNVKNYVFIGELGGCTGDSELYDLLMDNQFLKDNGLKLKEYFKFESFDGLHDYLIVVSKEEL